MIQDQFGVVCFEGGHGYALYSFAGCAEAEHESNSAKVQTATLI